jgi:hypothetical protein
MNLLGREYEPCKSCETLRVQLEIMRAENTRMLDTILGFVKPEVIVADVKHTEPIKGKAMSWHQRKTLLEAESRERARAIKTLKLSNDAIGQSNSGIEELEKELGIEDAS